IYRYQNETRSKDPTYYISEWCKSLEGRVINQVIYENNIPANGKFVFTDNKKILTKNKFAVPALYFSPGYKTEMVTCRNGLKNGVCETLYLNRTKDISENFDKAFRLHPSDGESYTVTEFKNGIADGNRKRYDTEEKELVEWVTDRFKKIKRTYTYLKVEANYTDGKLNGPYKEYFYNGKPAMQVNFAMDKFDGKMEVFTIKGEPLTFANWKNGIREGAYGEFRDGKKKVEANFENDLLNGDYIEYNYKTGVKLYQLNCKQSFITNKKLFFENGNLKEEVIFEMAFGVAFSSWWMGSESFLQIRETYKTRELPAHYLVDGIYKSYFENGKILCEGKLSKGVPSGTWKFYNVAGNLINEVNFINNSKSGMLITGYFNNGKLRCKGFVLNWETGYDCSTHQDKTKFEIDYKEAWSFDGTQILSKGNGGGIFMDENGSRIFSGEFVNNSKNGLWKYYDPNGKLNESGKYKMDVKDGLWFYGDLENLNFEDGACYDENNAYAKKMFQQNQQKLKLRTELYKDGSLIEHYDFETDLNKEREYSGGSKKQKTRTLSGLN
ncbi:MAG: hypothetical protein IAF38_01945, partial [Bacteroidia bacterium]|nr:hypothetical protein [Bacteroidia bacterium]